MTSMTLDLPRRFPWPTALSVVLHGAVVAGLLYTSVHHQVIELPAPAQPISVTMVAPAELEPPQPEVVQPPPEPVAEPEPEPIPDPPKEAPVVIHKPEPKPKPKPKPKPVKKVEEPKRDVKPVEPRPAAQTNTAPARPAPVAKAAPVTSTAPVATGPRALSRNSPTYPQRARALRLDGNVRVQFDVEPDGSVTNINVLEGKNSNLFAREVKMAVKKWRYESGKPARGMTVNVIFKLNGSATME